MKPLLYSGKKILFIVMEREGNKLSGLFKYEGDSKWTNQHYGQDTLDGFSGLITTDDPKVIINTLFLK